MVARTKTETTPVADNTPTVMEAPDDWAWEVKAEAAPTGVIFENFGDTFVGQYMEMRHIEREPAADGSDQSFDLFIYRGRDNELYSLNSSFALAEGMDGIDPGTWCRIKYVKDVPTGRNQNPMKSFQIDVRTN
jgi:hypothetical protein